MTSSEIGFHLDLAGGAEVLKETAAELVGEIAAKVAAAAGPDATVTQKVTDRSRASVRVPSDQQAKDGVLSRAATAVGLEVVQYPRTGGKGRTRNSRAKGKK
ncbi:hypothetical protein HMPREF0591_4811 [Mycobacterium parascrofulaceum ATCC BAA-614]|uniref:Uncharacterized protein n=1 Tax=Mycobacterium parascrofulaceum ATCC BAA-614 TaxID=525368 RepID=D5PF67_9MYCO|nr:hypothetical protein [Mycobacterium parascrofulaceum]EFG75248.1 hypothetical protein HMPREF0591_4811 [Mycobacterium parascrofulaceum ATCC BAA-614]